MGKKKDFLTIPNILSLIRIMLVILFCIFYFTDLKIHALFILILSGLSDVLDGFIARRFNQVSNFGKVLDPFADKLFTISTIICFSIGGLLPWWITVIIFSKEAFMIIGGIVLFKKTQGIIPAHWYGKLTTVLFFVTFVISLFFEILGLERTILEIIVVILFCLTVAFSFFSLIRYIILAIKINNDKKKNDAKIVA